MILVRKLAAFFFRMIDAATGPGRALKAVLLCFVLMLGALPFFPLYVMFYSPDYPFLVQALLFIGPYGLVAMIGFWVALVRIGSIANQST